MKINRRDFLTNSSGLLLSPLLNIKTDLLKATHIPSVNHNNILVIIHLAGGNDWFNTIIPYRDAAYYKLRPHLSLKANTLLQLNNEFAFHSALSEFKTAYDQNEVAILLNYGSSKHDLSHSKAIKYCQYINADITNASTWQARYAELIGSNKNFPAINVIPIFCNDGAASKEKIITSSLNKSNGFAFNLDHHYRLDTTNTQDTTENGFLSTMQRLASDISQDTDCTIYNISLGGFDTHENQLPKHTHLLSMLSQGISSFKSALDKNNMADRVLTVVCSEFGRSLKENDTNGTDHGYTNHALVIGKAVNGGIYKLSQSPQSSTAYGLLWSAILDKWLYCSSKTILGQSYNTPAFIKNIA